MFETWFKLKIQICKMLKNLTFERKKNLININELSQYLKDITHAYTSLD